MNKHSEKIAHLIKAKVRKGVDIDVVLGGVVEALKESGQSALLAPALKRTARLLKRDLLTETLVIESPFEVSDDLLQDITKKIVKESDPLRVVTLKPELIAGFSAKYQGKQYDASAKKYINKLMQQ